MTDRLNQETEDEREEREYDEYFRDDKELEINEDFMVEE